MPRCLALAICLFLFLLPAAASEDAWFLVFLNTNPDRPTLAEDSAKALQAGHIRNIQRLAKLGKLHVAGPFHTGGGIFIMKMGSEAEVWDSLRTDPAVRANRFNLEVLPMSVEIGGICTASEPNQMVTYAFLRHQWKHLERSSLEHVDSLLVAITFGNQRGGVILLRTAEEDRAMELLRNLLDDHPAESYTLRRLYVGKGSFCEE